MINFEKELRKDFYELLCEELFDCIEMCEKALYDAHHKADIMKMPNINGAIQQCGYILDKYRRRSK